MIPFDVTGTATLVAANGDQLFATVTETAVKNAGQTTGTNLVTITGDTGRFADATGTLNGDYSAEITAQVGTVVSGPVALTIPGRISY